MLQKAIELILMRQLASCLAMPIAISDAQGQVIYVNEPAESVLGLSFESLQALAGVRLAEMLKATDLDGKPLPPAELPLRFAIENRRPTHRKFRIAHSDGSERCVEGTAFPLVSQGGDHVGTVSIFWETLE
jgi:PAS domain S-box-containing protein